MKKVFVFLLILFACIYANAQVTVYLEDGTTIQAPAYDASKFNVNANGTSYTHKEVLYLKDNDRFFVMNYKKGKLLKLKKRIEVEPINDEHLGLLYAFKYYNAKDDASTISDAYAQNITRQEFKDAYDKWVKKIRSGNTTATVAAIISLLVAGGLVLF